MTVPPTHSEHDPSARNQMGKRPISEPGLLTGALSQTFPLRCQVTLRKPAPAAPRERRGFSGPDLSVRLSHPVPAS